MKKNIITGIFIGVIVLIISLVAFKKEFKSKEEEPSYVITNESLKFQNEYEKDNDELKISIKSYNTIKYSSYDEIYELLNKKDGNYTIFLASSKNEESRVIAPIIVDAALDYNKEIYYLDIYDDMDNKKLDKNGKIKVVKEGTDNYHKLVKKLSDKLPVYEELKDNSIKRIYLPTIVFINNSKINVLSLKDYFEEDINIDDNEKLSILGKIMENWE